MSAASKHRQPRLRASCDGCFLAKVKCSKARPICSRCLACGIECRYSPSSRAGKPKSDNSNNHINNHSNSTSDHHNHHNNHRHHHHGSPIQKDMADDKTNLLYAAASMAGPPGLYRLDPGWQTPSSMDVPPGSAISRNHSISSELALLAMDENAAAIAAAVASGDIYSTGAIPWTTPPTDMSVAQFSDSPMSGVSIHPAAHGGFSMAAATSAATASSGMPWMDPSVMDMFSYGHGQHLQGQGYSQQHQHQQKHQQHQQQHQQQQQQMPTPGSIASSSANNYFPSPSTTPSLRQSPATGHKSVPLSNSSSNGGGYYYQNHQANQAPQSHYSSSNSSNNHHVSCVCFTACLHALQALHNASTPAAPPFDVVLTLNRNAVEGCAAMLACPRCMSRSGTHTAAMLLATLLGKITSFFKTASQSYFRGEMNHGSHGGGEAIEAHPQSEPTDTKATISTSTASITTADDTTAIVGLSGVGGVAGLGVSLGAYQLQGEDGRWLELEILNRELKKLEEVYSRFREVCGDLLFEDVAVSKAMIGYLGQNLGAALDLVNHRKADLQYV